MIYLDNASTTKVDRIVLEKMLPYLVNDYGNPGSRHKLGRIAKDAVEKARYQVANAIHAKPEQIIFTASGSEANTLALRGTLNYRRYIYGTDSILTSKVEHSSIDRYNCGNHKLPPSDTGEVRPCDVEDAINKIDVGMVSIQHTNNETGIRNMVEQIGELCMRENILFHTDCVQAFGSTDIDVGKLQCDFLSISGHKIHAPKGIGALYAHNPQILTPQIIGGENQEGGYRGGTENVAAIVGFGKACELMMKNLDKIIEHIAELKSVFYKYLLHYFYENKMSNAVRVNFPQNKQGKIISLTFDGIDAETLISALSAQEIYVSAGSACSDLEQKPSRVLKAMGFSDDEARNTIRISLSRMNTTSEMREAALKIFNTVKLMKDILA